MQPGAMVVACDTPSKSAILAHLPGIPRYVVVPVGESFTSREYPLECKPDVGERGRNVAIIRGPDELRRYLSAARQPTIVQQYVVGEEFGVFYYRYPHQLQGHIFSITRKIFPQVTGDGKRTLRDLIGSDPKASRIAGVYLAALDGRRVPVAGEPVPPVEIGSHSRGTVFLNGADLETDGLRRAIDQAARSHAGFYFGCFNLSAESDEAFKIGAQVAARGRISGPDRRVVRTQKGRSLRWKPRPRRPD